MRDRYRSIHTSHLTVCFRLSCAAIVCFLVCSTFAGAVESSSRASTSPAGMLGEGTLWATPWYAVEGDEAGPTVLVTGGVHGNEPAGSAAARQLLHWPIRSGKLIVVPEVNRLGLAAEMRWFPPDRNDKKLRDLNRLFPAAEDDAPRTELAQEMWNLVLEQDPDYVIDLHEGFDFHVSNPKSVGSSVIFTESPARTTLAESMLSVVNQAISESQRRFVPLSKSGAASGSLVRACTDRLGIDAFILETTFKDQRLSIRTRQHRMLVSTLLNKIGVIDDDCVNVLGPPSRGDQLRVAMFDGAGVSSNALNNLTKAVATAPDIALTRVGPADTQANVLRQFDVVLFPGGSGSKQGKAIGEAGREVVRQFAKQGGGIVGVCAGAYLCSAHYDWSLHVINTAVFNKTFDIAGVGRKSMWYRGDGGNVRIEFASEARDLLGHAGEVEVRYQNGPIVSPGKATHLPQTTTLAWFRSEVVLYEPQRGTMIDTPAILIADFGKGRVASISPHPESTPGLESVITNAVRWSARVGSTAPK